MWVKICGITSVADAQAAVAAGADAVGLNFVAGPRRIEVARAAEILAAVTPPVAAVALVPLAQERIPEAVADLLARWGVSRVQPYGDVTPEAVAGLREQGFDVLLVQRVEPGSFPQSTQAFLNPCGAAPPAAVILDAADPDRLGGTGRALDWAALADAQRGGACRGWPPLILAGGLNAENVGEAIRLVRPWGVDVSSGVESAPGVKDADRMRRFVAAARAAAR